MTLVFRENQDLTKKIDIIDENEEETSIFIGRFYLFNKVSAAYKHYKKHIQSKKVQKKDCLENDSWFRKKNIQKKIDKLDNENKKGIIMIYSIAKKKKKYWYLSAGAYKVAKIGKKRKLNLDVGWQNKELIFYE